MMAATGATPREYGLKVQSHPVLLVTSRMKMRTAKTLMLSFSGQLLETVVFHRDQKILQNNLDATRKLILSLPSPPERNPAMAGDSASRYNGYRWRDIPAAEVIDFLTSYTTHPGAHKVNGSLFAKFIESMTKERELTRWTIALIGASAQKRSPYELTSDVSIVRLKRSDKNGNEERYAIGRLMSPRDEAVDLGDDAWRAALKKTREAWATDPGRSQSKEEPSVPSGPAMRYVRGHGPHARRDVGLLLLYLLDPAEAHPVDSELRFPDSTPPIVGFGISFPGSNSGQRSSTKSITLDGSKNLDPRND